MSTHPTSSERRSLPPVPFLNSALCGITETVSIKTGFAASIKSSTQEYIDGGGDAFPLAKIGNRDLIVESLQDDPDFVFG